MPWDVATWQHQNNVRNRSGQFLEKTRREVRNTLHSLRPHPLLPVILLETEEILVGEHDALHVNTRAKFRQYPSRPKFQTWKKLLAQGVISLISLHRCATLRMALCTETMCQPCFLAMAAARKPAARSAFKRASVVAVHLPPLPMSVASKDKQLGLCKRLNARLCVATPCTDTQR